MAEQGKDHAEDGVSSSWVVVFGNPFDGLSIVGPFGSIEDAHSLGDSRTNSEWWAMKLIAPPPEFAMSEPQIEMSGPRYESDSLRKFLVHSSAGERVWQAETMGHAREQHEDAFPDEPIVWVRKLLR